MKQLRFDGFDWDEGNATKNLKKHGIAKETVEGLFDRELSFALDPRHSGSEPRFLAVGRTDANRPMLVAFTIRIKASRRLIRPISARYMHAKEIARYES
jgi:hypothetical protein